MEEGATKSGIDWAWQKESTWSYALHMLIGHHGLFSLTPIFLLSMGGALLGLRNAVGEAPDSAHSRISREQIIVMAATLALTAVVLCFYLFVTPRSTHNYGGWTCGPRQLMWLTPFLLLAMLPCLDRLGDRTWGRWLAVVLLVVSVFSVSNPGWNPWRHPWLYDLMNGIGIISY
jgi:Zn-dependent protease with chaperone function